MTAATGDVSDNHDIVTVTTNSIVYKQRSKKELDELRRYHLDDIKSKPSKKASWWSSSSTRPSSNQDGPGFLKRTLTGLFGLLWMLLKLAAVLAVVAAIIYAYLSRRKKLDVSMPSCLVLPLILSHSGQAFLARPSQTGKPYYVVRPAFCCQTKHFVARRKHIYS